MNERQRQEFEEFMSGDSTNWVDEYRFRRADGFYVYIYDQGQKFSGGAQRLIQILWRDGARVGRRNGGA